MIASFFNESGDPTSANTASVNTSLYGKIVVSPVENSEDDDEESSNYDDEARDLLV